MGAVLPSARARCDNHVDDAAIFSVHADERAVLGGLAHGFEDGGVVDHEHVGVGHEELEAGHAFARPCRPCLRGRRRAGRSRSCAGHSRCRLCLRPSSTRCRAQRASWCREPGWRSRRWSWSRRWLRRACRLGSRRQSWCRRRACRDGCARRCRRGAVGGRWRRRLCRRRRRGCRRGFP